MKLLSVLALVLATTGHTVAAADRSAPALPGDERVHAAECLRHSVTELIASSDDSPFRAGRIVALSEFAERLDPANPRTARLLAGIYQMRVLNGAALQSIEKCLTGLPDDYEMSLRWLSLKLEELNDAGRRINFLDSVVSDRVRQPSLRSQAAAQWAAILARQGHRDASVDAFARALELDPSNTAGLLGLLAAQESPSPAVVADTILWQLRGSPRSLDLAWQLAALLGQYGLYEVSLDMFDYAHAVSSWVSGRDVPTEFLTQYCNAMLDARRYRRATETFGPMLSKMPYNGDLHSLMVEAYRSLGQQKEAEQAVRAMAANYRAMEARASRQQIGALYAEIAWFHLFTMSDVARAVTYAGKAHFRGADTVTERILGVAEISTGDKAGGAARLAKLTDKDLYAAAFLAEHYFAEGDLEGGRKALEAGVALGRNGPAFRKLLDVAASQRLTVPPSEESMRLCHAYDGFGKSFMQIALAPEGFLSVRIRSPGGVLKPGAPVTIEASLTNIGKVPIPLGKGGLFEPRMSLQVSVSTPEQATFVEGLPMAVWPAPRYLQPAQTVTCIARLDVSDLADLLRANPLDEITLTVSGLLDPVSRGRAFVSAVPQLKPEPASIVRSGLLRSADGPSPTSRQKAYQLAIGRIVRDLRRGDLRARTAAVRQVASLICFIDRLRDGQASLPPELVGEVTKPVLLSLLRTALEDKSPTIRAQMLAELARMPVDRDVLRLLGDAINDPSPLVRLRAAELIGLSGSAGSQAVLAHLAADKDPLVRTMASIFTGSPAESRPG